MPARPIASPQGGSACGIFHINVLKDACRFGWMIFAALELWLWFDMAGLDYRAGKIFPFCTAGWFVLGQIFIIPIFGFAAWIISVLFRRWPRQVAVLGIIGLTSLLGTSIHNALPQQQLARLIGMSLARHSEIESMVVSDSFGDGLNYEGTLRIGPEFMKALRENSGFVVSKNHSARHHNEDHAGTLYRSHHVKLLITPDEKQCVFRSEWLPRVPETSTNASAKVP